MPNLDEINFPMTRIGITGGMGMGKSTCARLLRELGAPVIDTDDLARELVQPGQPASAEILTTFGSTVFKANGELDRAALAEVVFKTPAARQRLEAILHPRIQQAWHTQLKALEDQGQPVAAVVIPLLYETSVEAEFDAVICVACSSEEQAVRLHARGWTEAESRRRLDAQIPVVEKMRRADYVIWSEGSVESHRRQVVAVLARLVEGL